MSKPGESWGKNKTHDDLIAMYRRVLDQYRNGEIGIGGVMLGDGEAVMCRQRHAMLLSLLMGEYPIDRNVLMLEVGCRFGMLAQNLPAVKHYVGIDIVPEFIEMATQFCQREMGTWAEFRVSRLEDWYDTADVVLACMFLSGAIYDEPWPGVLVKLCSLADKALAFDCQDTGRPARYRVTLNDGPLSSLRVEEAVEILYEEGFRQVKVRWNNWDTNTVFSCAAVR